MSTPSSVEAARKWRAYLRGLGREDSHEDLETPERARLSLDVTGRGDLSRLIRQLHGSWLDGQPHHAIARALQGLERSTVVVFPSAPSKGPRWLVHTLRGRPYESELRRMDLLPKARLYAIRGPDPFADRPVPISRLYGGRPPLEAMAVAESIFRVNGVGRQLRMAVYHEQEIVLYVGLYRELGERAHSRRVHAVLQAAQPALRDWGRTAAAIGVAPLGDGALARTLDALDRPALLMRRGHVVFANAAGRRFHTAAKTWDRRGRPAGFGAVTPLAPGGLEVDLVLPDDAGRSGRSPGSDALPHHDFAGSVLDALPPSLRRIATRLAAGASDKDIAQELEIPLTTTRTYVSRVLERLDLRSRRELMRLAAGAAPRPGNGGEPS